jgi:NADH:ubiquinone oxidoreductase subunit 6 (subunit J)
VLLIGGPASPITDQGTVLLAYLIGGLLLIGALGMVLVRNALQAVIALVATAVLVAVLYLVISDSLLALVQLLVFAVGVGPLLYLVVRQTYGFGWEPTSLSNRLLIPAAAVAVVVLVLLAGVFTGASWPSGMTQSIHTGLGPTLGTYAVPLASIALMAVSAAMAARVLLRALPRTPIASELSTRDRKRRRPDARA